MEFNEQDVNYLLNILAQRPLAEALPLFLKMTKQQLVPVPDDKGRLTPVRQSPGAE